MFSLDIQPVIQADAIGIFLLALLVAPFIIPAIVKKAKISEAEDIKNNYPDGYKRVMRYPYSSIDYQDAKEIVNKRAQIVSAQREYDEEKRKATEERQLRDKVNELRRSCPYATEGKTDSYIISNEYSIRQIEQKHKVRENRAKRILQENPLGVKELFGFISDWSISDDNIDKLINNETVIHDKQRECAANEAELKTLKPHFDELKRKFPLGIVAICREKQWSTSNAEHVKQLLSMPLEEVEEKQREREEKFINNEGKLSYAVKKTKAWIAKTNKHYAKTFVAQDYGENVANRVMEIIDAEEEFKVISRHLDSITRKQNDFALETRNLFPNILTGWGYYNYSFEMDYVDDYSHTKKNKLTVWQAFVDACCFAENVSYEYYPYLKTNRVKKKELEHNTCYYLNQTWDKVLSFISRIRDKYGDEVFVILANTEHIEENAYNNNLNYLEEQLKKKGIPYGETILTKNHVETDKKYIVIDIITYNSSLKQYCSALFHYRHIMQLGTTKGSTGVVFITMMKCYDGVEVEELNQRKIKEQEDAIRFAKEEEERRNKERNDISEAKSIATTFPVGFRRYFPNSSSYSIDASQARIIIRNRSAIQDYEDSLSRLRNRVSDWDTVRGVPHYFFYYYYPTRFTNISPDSQEARRLVYNFKDGLAHNRVKDLVVNKIRNTFSSSDLSRMCFTCIPASTRSVHESRYKDFSSEVSQALGMSNAYDHITITKEKTPSHLGGDDRAEYSYDGTFFNGKFVILFDDIVTRGSSVSSMKADLEVLGAIVICAISIGRTYSDWNGNSPKPHPYTGRV